jgi:hypothetical protein
MNNGNNGKNVFNFSGFSNFFKRREAAAKAAATRRATREAAPTRIQPSRARETTAVNVNMVRTRTNRNNNIRPRKNIRAQSPERVTRRNNNANRNRKPASEIVAPGKKKSLYDQALYILEKQADPLAANNTKRRYQLSHYERQLTEFTEFVKTNPYNVHNGVISDAIAVLRMKLGHSLPSSGANVNMSIRANNSSSAAASSGANTNSTPIFSKERTIEELLKIRDYMERRAAGAVNVNTRNRRINGAKSDNFRRFLGLLYESANYHIQQLDSANDSLEALHLHSGKQFLDELAQNLEGTAVRPPTPQEQEEANQLIDELAKALADTTMKPASFSNENNI